MLKAVVKMSGFYGVGFEVLPGKIPYRDPKKSNKALNVMYFKIK